MILMGMGSNNAFKVSQCRGRGPWICHFNAVLATGLLLERNAAVHHEPSAIVTKKVQVQIKEANGKKKMRLTEYINGKERVTMYEGDAVDKKLTELEASFPNSKQ